MKSVFLWYQSQNDVPLFQKFRLTFTRTTKVEKSSYRDRKFPVIVRNWLKADTVMETKLAFKQVKTTGHCSTVHGKCLIVLDFLVTTTSTDTLPSKRTLSLLPLSNKSLVNWSLPCLPLTFGQLQSLPCLPLTLGQLNTWST